jgi:hypothetical protein
MGVVKKNSLNLNFSTTTGDTGSSAYTETGGKSVVELTSTIWGFDDFEKARNKSEAYFYTDATPYVQLSGIDVTIKYGYEFDGKDHANNQPARIEKLKNVQLRSIGKQIAPNGEPIAELYEFVARNIE